MIVSFRIRVAVFFKYLPNLSTESREEASIEEKAKGAAEEACWISVEITPGPGKQ